MPVVLNYSNRPFTNETRCIPSDKARKPVAILPSALKLEENKKYMTRQRRDRKSRSRSRQQAKANVDEKNSEEMKIGAMEGLSTAYTSESLEEGH